MDERTRQHVGSSVRPEVVRSLERATLALGKDRSTMRVLDWGCGIGTAVAELRLLGWDASGADIDADAIDRGNETIPGKPLHAIERGQGPWQTGSFDFIFSQDTFEHVADIHAAVQEISRLSARGAFGFHTFPAKLRLVEPHVFVPFLHWLPKNRLMSSYLWVCCHAGIGHSSEANKRALAGLTAPQSAAFSYRYMRDNTFYRSYRAVRSEFQQAGFAVTPRILDHPRLARVARALHAPVMNRLAQFLLLNFVTVQIEARRVKSHN